MTALAIKRFLDSMGIIPAKYFINDREYSLPKLEYLNGNFASDFYEYLKAWNLLDYEPEKFDCDNFAMNAMTLASNVHAKTPRGMAKGLAFGVFNYDRGNNPDDGHAINFAIVIGKNGVPQIAFFEPQRAVERLPLQIQLSRAEIESCDGYALLG